MAKSIGKHGFKMRGPGIPEPALIILAALAYDQYTAGITLHGPINNALSCSGLVAIITVSQLKTVTAILAAITLFTATRFTMAVDVMTLTGSTFNFDRGHSASSLNKGGKYSKLVPQLM